MLAHVLRTHKLALHNRAWHQMNQIFKTTVQCIHHSLELLPSVCRATGQWTCWWSVGQDSPSRCALCPRDHPGWKLECDTRSAAELPRQHSRPDLSRGCWVANGHTDSSMKFSTVRCRNLTVDFARWDGVPSCWNTKWLSDFWRISGRRHRCSRVSP